MKSPGIFQPIVVYLSFSNRLSFFITHQPFVVFLFHAKLLLFCVDQVKKEWHNPIQHNSFALPFLNCILMSWLATRWTGGSFSGDLARVLYWMGTVSLSSLTIFTIARCVVRRFEMAVQFSAYSRVVVRTSPTPQITEYEPARIRACYLM